MKLKKLLFTILFTSILAIAQPKPYVLLVSFDGFRWDYLNRNITPNLDLVAQNGVKALSFRPIYPSKTFPNHISIITGMYAENHGILFNQFENIENGDIYRLGDSAAVRNSSWYKGEAFWETAEKNNITSASFFWPGSEVNEAKRRPTYYKKYEHNLPYRERIDGIAEWLKLPQSERPHFITLYFHDTDSYGHDFGPNSPEINQSIQRLDTLVGYLNKKLSEIGMQDSVNVIFLSDHGMTEVDIARTIKIENILSGLNYKFAGAETLSMIEPSESDFDSVFARLERNQSHFRVYKKENMPNYYHFNQNSNIFSILLVAELGWSIVDNKQFLNMRKYASKGNHGFENTNIDMHGIFLASGPQFRNGFLTGTIWNIDVYPLLCKIFNIAPNHKIDGNLERIGFLLK